MDQVIAMESAILLKKARGKGVALESVTHTEVVDFFFFLKDKAPEPKFNVKANIGPIATARPPQG